MDIGLIPPSKLFSNWLSQGGRQCGCQADTRVELTQSSWKSSQVRWCHGETRELCWPGFTLYLLNGEVGQSWDLWSKKTWKSQFSRSIVDIHVYQLKRRPSEITVSTEFSIRSSEAKLGLASGWGSVKKDAKAVRHPASQEKQHQHQWTEALIDSIRKDAQGKKKCLS